MRKKPDTPDGLAFEGRNLVDAYFAAYENWRVASAACCNLPDDTPFEANKPFEVVSDNACMIAKVCEDALRAFVIRASGRKPLEHPSDCMTMDLWPAAAVQLDGRLWVVVQEQNSEAGELQLCHTIMADVVRLPEKGGDS